MASSGSSAAQQCAVHPDIAAGSSCVVCFKNLCDDCAVYEVDAASCCDRCGRDREDESRALSSGLLALVGVGYLATIAVGIVIFKARPFVGGIAAIVAIALGRAMQLLVKAPTVVRRLAPPAALPATAAQPRAAAPRPVDATPEGP
jgi:hypothetical protein